MKSTWWTEPVTRLDNDDEYETVEEAIAVALSELEPGGIVAVHDDDCASDGEDADTCTCEPLLLVKGAQA